MVVLYTRGLCQFLIASKTHARVCSSCPRSKASEYRTTDSTGTDTAYKLKNEAKSTNHNNPEPFTT